MKRRTTYILMSAFATLAVLGVIGWTQRWQRLESMRDIPRTPLAAPIMTPEEHDRHPHARPYILDLTHGSGKLVLIGVDHTKDPSNYQIDTIKARFAASQPSVALVEGRMGFFIGPLGPGVRQFGESGAVYSLARSADIPIRTLEPAIEDEIAMLREQWSPERVTLYYVLRGFMSDRGDATGDDATQIAASVLAKRGTLPGLDGAISSIDELDSLYRADFPGAPDWRVQPEEFMWPGRHDSYLNEMATLSSKVRDEHMVRLLVHLVEKGERVFAVVGASHVIMQEPALRAVLGGLPLP
jgi:hypothetical protein